jgi:transposase-like protein
MPRASDPALRAAWQRRLRALEDYPGTVQEFCNEQGVSVAALYQWRRKLARQPTPSARPAATTAESASPQFVPLTLVSEQQSDSPRLGASIQLVGGTRVDVQSQSLELMQALLQSLFAQDARLPRPGAAEAGGAP